MAVKYEKTRYPGVLVKSVAGRNGDSREKMFVIQYRSPDKRQHMEPCGRSDEGMTAKKAMEIRAERMNGKALPNKERREQERVAKRAEKLTTVQGLWELYDSEHAERSSRKSDIAAVSHLGGLLSKSPAELTTRDITLLRKKLEKTPSRRKKNEYLTPQTVKHVMEILRRILLYADRQGLSPYPEGLVFDFPSLDNETTENLTKEQYAKLWEFLSTDPDTLGAQYMKLILLTGIRKSAALALRWSDVDFENRTLTLRGENAKNGKTVKIPLIRPAAEVLSSIPNEGSEWVFPSASSATGHRDNFNAIGRRMKESLELPDDFRMNHGLRHVFAAWMARSGKVSVYELSALMTHSSPAMTKRYISFFPEELRNKLDAAEDTLPIGTSSGN